MSIICGKFHLSDVILFDAYIALDREDMCKAAHKVCYQKSEVDQGQWAAALDQAKSTLTASHARADACSAAGTATPNSPWLAKRPLAFGGAVEVEHVFEPGC